MSEAWETIPKASLNLLAGLSHLICGSPDLELRYEQTYRILQIQCLEILPMKGSWQVHKWKRNEEQIEGPRTDDAEQDLRALSASTVVSQAQSRGGER
jgi:hypothetical protein